ncbi:hypothetical protein WDU94_007565 [Cyamophila willieti]
MSKTLHYSEGIVTKQNIFENLNAVNPETNELKNPPKAPAKKLKPKRKKKSSKVNKENTANNSDVQEEAMNLAEECTRVESVEAAEKEKKEVDVKGGVEERMEQCDAPNPASESSPVPPQEPLPDSSTAQLHNPSSTESPSEESAPPTELVDSTLLNPSDNQSEPPSTNQAPPLDNQSETSTPPPPQPTIRYGYPTIQFVNSSFRRGRGGGRGGGVGGRGGGGERREEESGKPGRSDYYSRPSNPRAGPYPTNRPYPANPSNPASSKPADRDTTRPSPVNHSNPAGRDTTRPSPANPSNPAGSKPADRENNKPYQANPTSKPQDRPRPARGGRPAPSQPARDIPASNNNQPNKPSQQPNEKLNPSVVVVTTNPTAVELETLLVLTNPMLTLERVNPPVGTAVNTHRQRDERKETEMKDGQSVVPLGGKELAAPTQATGRRGNDKAQSGKAVKDAAGPPVPLPEINNGKQSTPPPPADSPPTAPSGKGKHLDESGAGSNSKTNGTVAKPSVELGNKTVPAAGGDRSNKSSVEKEGPINEQSRGEVKEHSRPRTGERQRYAREERDRDSRPRREERDRDVRPRGEERDRGYSGQNRGYHDRYPDERRGAYRRSFAPDSNRDADSMGPPPPPRRGRNSAYRSNTRQHGEQGVSGSQNERPRNGYVSSSDDHLVNGDVTNTTSSSTQRSSSRNKRRPLRNRISGERRVHTKPHEPSPPEAVTSHSVDGTEHTVSSTREFRAQSDSRARSENIVMNGTRDEESRRGESLDNTRDKDGKTKKWSDESWADDAPRKPSPYEEQTNRVKVTHEPVNISTRVSYNLTVQEVQGDLMAAPVEYSLAIGVSEDFRMPSGLPAQFRTEFRRLDTLLDQQVRVGEVACLEVKSSAPASAPPPRHVFYLVTKRLAHQKPVLKSMRSCLDNLRRECTRRRVRCIAMPQLGSGPDRLDWRDVKPLIEQAFDGSDIQVLVYIQNEDQESDSKAQKSKLAKLTLEPKPVVNIEEWTSIIALTSADGQFNAQQVHALHDKFDILDEFERQLPDVSVGSVISMKRSNYFLSFFIVSPSSSTPFKFESIFKCLQSYKRHLHKDFIEYVAFEVLADRNAPNELLNEKLISFMKNSLPSNISLHVCWPEHIEDRYFISRTKPTAAGNNHQSAAPSPRIENYAYDGGYQGNGGRYHSNKNNASSGHGFHSNSQASSNNNRLIQIDSNRHFPKL